MKKTEVKINKPVHLGMLILDISKRLGMITLNQSIRIKQSYLIRMLIALLFIL